DRHRGRAIEGEDLLDHLRSDEEPLRGALVRREDDAVLASYAHCRGHVEPRTPMWAVGYVDSNGPRLVTRGPLPLAAGRGLSWTFRRRYNRRTRTSPRPS